MATKKPTSISKHKTTTARKPAKPVQPQAFDIIPKSKVRPSTTSRPVITSSTPAVADNTLTTSSGAPTLQVKRRSIVINPSEDADLSKEDVMPNLATSVGSVPTAQPAETATSPNTEGVAVGDLIAKRAGAEKTVIPLGDPSPETEPSPPTTPVESSASDANPGSTPELPADEQGHVDDQAAAEAARLLSDASEASATDAASSVASTDTPEDETNQTAEVVPASEVTSVPEAAEPEVATMAAKPDDQVTAVPTPDVSTPVLSEPTLAEPAEPQQPAVKSTETETAPPPAAEKPDETSIASDTLKDVLQEESVKPQEHSQALKDAMKDMDGKPQHHELYGGKPVIVVHKEHGAMSAVAWVFWFFLCLGLAVLIVNFLLDAGFIETTYRVPHTNIL